MLFAQKGFNATSTRDIASKADVNLGLIAYYFGTKKKLLQDILQRKIGFYKDSFIVIENMNLSTIEKLNAMIDVYINHMFENRHFHLIVNTEVHSAKSNEHKTHFNNLIYENAQIFHRIIENGIKKNEIRKGISYKYIMPSIIGIVSIHIQSEQLMKKCLDIDEKNKKADNLYLENLRSYLKELLKTYLEK